MKRICFLLGALNGKGGTGRAVSLLANQLCEKYAVHMVCYCQDLANIGYPVDERIPVAAVYDSPRSMVTGIFGMIRFLRAFLKENQIEVLLACGVLQFPGAIIAARLAGVKIICCDHSNYTCVSDAKFERQCRNFAARFSDHLVTLTQQDIRNYQQGTTVKAKICAIPNLVDDALTSRGDIPYNWDSRKIISVGRLTYAKNYELMIDIAAQILCKHPEWSWDIYGDGELRQSLEEKLEKTGVERLRLMGNCADIYERYSQYAFLVMTSRYEGFPMVLLEALANGVPCVAFDCQTGPGEIILDGVNGLLVEKENREEMIAAIEKMITDDTYRYELSSHAGVSLERFKKEHILSCWDTLIS